VANIYQRHHSVLLAAQILQRTKLSTATQKLTMATKTGISKRPAKPELPASPPPAPVPLVSFGSSRKGQKEQTGRATYSRKTPELSSVQVPVHNVQIYHENKNEGSRPGKGQGDSKNYCRDIPDTPQEQAAVPSDVNRVCDDALPSPAVPGVLHSTDESLPQSAQTSRADDVEVGQVTSESPTVQVGAADTESYTMEVPEATLVQPEQRKCCAVEFCGIKLGKRGCLFCAAALVAVVAGLGSAFGTISQQGEKKEPLNKSMVISNSTTTPVPNLPSETTSTAAGNWVKIGSDVVGMYERGQFGYSLSTTRDGKRMAVGGFIPGDIWQGLHMARFGPGPRGNEWEVEAAWSKYHI